MTNREIAGVLEAIADILQIKEESFYRVRAYRTAADAVYHLDKDIKQLYKEGKLEDISGVGSSVKAIIEEVLEKGKSIYLEELFQEIPPGLLEMLEIPGIGHKTVRIIYNKLGVDNLEDLLKAAEGKKIRDLPGMGGKTEYNIKKGIELLKKREGKVTLGLSQPLAEELLQYLAKSDVIKQASITGSIRRGKPLVSDIDIIVSSDDYKSVHQYVEAYRGVRKILHKESDRIVGELSYNIKFEVIIVPPEDYYNRLVWTTGSREHCIAIWGENEQQLNMHKAKSEEEVYQRFGLQYIEPEMRENRGEIELARRFELPELVVKADLRGDLHVHTEWSDGGHSIQDMVLAAKVLNYQYIAITDHSKSLPISGGLTEERLHAQGKVIDALNDRQDDFVILKGIEVDVLKDGSLDFDDGILSKLDLVIASVHSNFNLNKDKQTERIMKVIENKYVHVIGHLTGRLLNRRPGYDIDLDEILAAVARNNKVLEINSHPDRLDIDEHVARRAKEMGIKIAINSDAHHQQDLNLVKYGVKNARRGWLEPENIINTWNIERLWSFLKKKI